MHKTVKFSLLRSALVDAGFTMRRVPGSHFLFTHATTSTTFALPLCGAGDDLPAILAVGAARLVDERGIQNRAEFERRVSGAKPSVRRKAG